MEHRRHHFITMKFQFFILLVLVGLGASENLENLANKCIRGAFSLIHDSDHFSEETITLATDEVASFINCDSQVECLRGLLDKLAESNISDAPKLAKELIREFAPCLSILEPVPSLLGL